MNNVVTCHVFGRTYWFVANFSSSKYEVNRFSAAIITGILVFPTVLLNLIPILTILKSSQLKDKICYFLILVQSVIDLGVGCIGTPLSFFQLIIPFLHYMNCYAIFTTVPLSFLFTGVSIVNLFVMSFERFIGVLYPYSYTTLLTKKRVLRVIHGGFMLVLLVVALSFRFDTIGIFVFVTVPALIVLTSFVFTKIYLEIKRLQRSEVRPCVNGSVEHKSKIKLFLREVKHAKSCFLVVVCFLITLAPSSFYPIFFSWHGPSLSSDAYFSWVVVFATLHSCLNSVIFFWNSSVLTKEAVKVLKAFCCCS